MIKNLFTETLGQISAFLSKCNCPASKVNFNCVLRIRNEYNFVSFKCRYRIYPAHTTNRDPRGFYLENGVRLQTGFYRGFGQGPNR